MSALEASIENLTAEHTTLTPKTGIHRPAVSSRAASHRDAAQSAIAGFVGADREDCCRCVRSWPQADVGGGQGRNQGRTREGSGCESGNPGYFGSCSACACFACGPGAEHSFQEKRIEREGFGPRQLMATAKFSLGSLVATPGALTAIEASGQQPDAYLLRHGSGDWGELDADDRQSNETAIEYGLRILSAYQLPTGVRIWIITEADRCSTCILLPEEY